MKNITALFPKKEFSSIFFLFLVSFGYGQLVPCPNNNDDAPPFSVADAYNPNYGATLELATAVIGPGDDFCIGNDPGKDTEGGKGSFLFTGLTGGQDGCPVEFCFSPRQGCGSALGNTCIWVEDTNNPGQWISLGQATSENICILAPAGVTEFAIVISRPGMGPVSVNDVMVNQPPPLSLGVDQTECETDLPKDIDLTSYEPSGQTGGTWMIGGSPVANPAAYSLSGVNGDMFTFEYTYDASNDVGYTCMVSDGIKFTINDDCCVEPNLTTLDGSVCAEGQSSIDLNSLVTSNGTVSFHTSQGDADANLNALLDSNVSPLLVTTYFVRSEVDANCFVTDLIEITIEELPVVPILTVEDATCEAAGSASLVPVAGLTYTVSPSGTVDGSGNITGLVAGTPYTVTAENASGCTADSAAFMIGATLDAVDAPIVTVEDATCEMAGSASLVPVAGLTYTVSPSGTVEVDGSITGLTPGTPYTVTATNASDCSADSEVFMIGATLDAVDVPVVTVVDATCEAAGSASLVPVAGLTYTVSPSGTVDGSGNITGLVAGTPYTVTAENASGCSADSAAFMIGATLDAVDAPIVTVEEATCEMVGSASLVPVAGLTYTVSPSGTVEVDGSITGLVAGTPYTVTAENASGCTADSAAFMIGATLDAVDVPIVTVEEATCEMAGSASLVPVAGLTYTISPSGTVEVDGSITGLVAGTPYTVTAENVSGCTADSAAFMIGATLDAVDAPIVTVEEATCEMAGSASLVPVAGLTYTVSPSGTVEVDGSITGLIAGTPYTVTAENASGCTADSAIFTIGDTLDAVDEPMVTVVDATCEMAGSASVSNFDAALTYTVSPSGTVDGSGSITGLVAGTPYTVTAENDSGCTADSAAFMIGATLDAAEVPVIAVVEATCELSGQASISNYDDTALSYTFNPVGPGVDALGNISGYTADIAYTVTVENAEGCTAESIAFTIDSQLETPDDVFDTATVCGDESYTWDRDGKEYTFGDSPIMITLEGENGCEYTATLTLTEDEAPDAGSDNTTAVCESSIVDLADLVTVQGGTFTNTSGQGTLTDSSFDTSGLDPGDYVITYTVGSANCGADEAEITVSVAEDIILQTCEAEPATFCGDGTTKYDFYWFGSENSPGGSRFFGSNTSNLTFTEFNDGTALIQGNTTLGSCTATLYIKLDGKKNWSDWQSEEGGTFKNMGCTNPNPANLEYYVIDNTVSTITTNGGDCLEEGTFIVSQKPDPNDPTTPHLGVIVGPGGVLHGLDPTANGIAGWGFMGTEANPKKYEIDFNFELNCTDATGCDLEQSCDNLVPNAGVSSSYTACEDEMVTMNGLYELLGNTAEFGGTWSPATFNGPGDYTYTHAASGTCSEKSATVTVMVQGKLNAGADGAITICESDILTNEDLFALLVDADEGGSWSDPIDGVYTYTIGGSGSCAMDTATVTVTYVVKPNAGTDGEITICNLAMIPTDNELFMALEGNPDSGGTWERTNDFFEYTVQGAGSCIDNAFVVIHREGAPNAGEDGALEICEGTTLSEEALFAALTDADNGGTWSGPEEGVYAYRVSTDCGLDTAYVTVTEMEMPSAGEDGTLTICEGFELSAEDLFAALTGADAGGTWSDSVAGVYTYTVSVDCGDDSATVTVSEKELLSAGEDGTLTICEGDDLSPEDLFATLSGADAGGTWSGPVDGVHTYMVISECGDDSAVVTVTEVTKLSAGEDGTLSVCEDTTPSEEDLFAALNGADLGGTWSGPVAGVYTYSFEMVCLEDSATVTVTEIANPEAGLDNSITVCEGDSVDLSTLVSEAGGTFENSSGIGSLVDMSYDTSDLDAGEYILTYTVTNSCGEDTAAITVVVDEVANCTNVDCDFEVTTEKLTNEKCPGDAKGIIHIKVSEGQPNDYTYSWSHDADEDKWNLNQLSAGDYTVTVTDANGCSVEHNVTVGLDSDTCKSGKNGLIVKTKVVPHPMVFADVLNLSVEIGYGSISNMRFYDMTGRLVMERNNITIIEGENELTFNVAGLAPDMYILVLNTGKENIKIKVVVVK